MPRYVFNPDYKPISTYLRKADPQAIGDALATIAESVKGRLTPVVVIKAARNRRHPLHRCFEWKDSVAAEAWRKHQARELIRSIRIVRDDVDPDAATRADTSPAFLSVASNGRAYHTVAEVISSAALQLQVLKQAERDLRAFEFRYRELLDVCELVRSARERVGARIERIEAESRPT